MKPVLQRLVDSPDQGFASWVVRGRYQNPLWHFHHECELIYNIKGTGSRLVGDHFARLRPGDLTLLGPQLPHSYHNDPATPGRRPQVHALLLQFSDATFSEEWWELPALSRVRRLVRSAAPGLLFTGATRDRVAELMRELVELSGLQRIIRLLDILDTLAASRECRPLASAAFLRGSRRFNPERMTQVWRFIHEHLNQPIFVSDLARMVRLSRGAFSRFFHLHTNKTLPLFVNELRVGRACQMLAEGEMNVTEIALACGFSNMSNFNRQFLRLKNTTPLRFRREVLAPALRSQ